MKRSFLYILIAIIPFLASCFKDKGNYDYINLGEPVLTNMDSLYTVFTGDSLIIAPKITLGGGRSKASCHWIINVPAEAKDYTYDGLALRIVFGLPATRYTATLVVTDEELGMKYYYPFLIVSKTEFTTGTVVLTDDGGEGKLSFVKPDGEVKADLYNAINGESLGTKPLQIVQIRNANYMNVITGYWLVCEGGSNPAVQISSDNLKRIKYLKENFYSPQGTLRPSYFQNLSDGTTTAIINDKLYGGSFETAPFATYYGFFGNPLAGDYTLGTQMVYNFNNDGTYYLAYDKVKRSLVRFDRNTYFGTDYTLQDTAFNPKDLKMDLLDMRKVTNSEIYAFCDSVGQTYELKFGVDFLQGNSKFKTAYKRKFVGDSLLTADTKWQASSLAVFYFTSNDKIYRYNPLNQELRLLDTDFGGKQVTMIKVLDDGNRMLAGTDGSLYVLDISTGKYGEVIKRTDGLPGKVVDALLRE